MDACAFSVYTLACISDQEAYNLGLFFYAYYTLFNSWVTSEAAFHAAWDHHIAA